MSIYIYTYIYILSLLVKEAPFALQLVLGRMLTQLAGDAEAGHHMSRLCVCVCVCVSVSVCVSLSVCVHIPHDVRRYRVCHENVSCMSYVGFAHVDSTCG